jgi:hypothetical protein
MGSALRRLKKAQAAREQLKPVSPQVAAKADTVMREREERENARVTAAFERHTITEEQARDLDKRSLRTRIRNACHWLVQHASWMTASWMAIRIFFVGEPASHLADALTMTAALLVFALTCISWER